MQAASGLPGAAVPAGRQTPVLTSVGPGAREGWRARLLEGTGHVLSLPACTPAWPRPGEGGSSEGRHICPEYWLPSPHLTTPFNPWGQTYSATSTAYALGITFHSASLGANVA